MNRQQCMAQWIVGQLQQLSIAVETGGDGNIEIVPLSGDASFRRYFRVPTRNGAVVVADAPPDKEKNREFVLVSRMLSEAGVNVPQVLAADMEQGFLLLNDLGDQTLLPLLIDPSCGFDSVEAYYHAAIDMLIAQQSIETQGLELPHYSASLLEQEMALFPQWFVAQLLNYQMNDAERDMLAGVFNTLINSALEQPQVFVHRDYHSRNIMLVDVPGSDTRELATIDFQDAVLGPISYDLVSLLRDCYVCWPQTLIERLVRDYLAIARQAGRLPPSVNEGQFFCWFDLMGLQRHIKVLGIFARLSLRDGKQGYLKDLPLVIHYTRSIAARYREFNAFCQWFDTQLLPRIEKQDWWRECVSAEFKQ